MRNHLRRLAPHVVPVIYKHSAIAPLALVGAADSRVRRQVARQLRMIPVQPTPAVSRSRVAVQYIVVHHVLQSRTARPESRVGVVPQRHQSLELCFGHVFSAMLTTRSRPYYDQGFESSLRGATLHVVRVDLFAVLRATTPTTASSYYFTASLVYRNSLDVFLLPPDSLTTTPCSAHITLTL